MKKKRVFFLIFSAVVLASIFFNSASVSASSTVLKKGMSGSEVSKLQESLVTVGFLNTKPTGYFGDQTKAAVLKLQADYGLEEDGIAGPAVFAVINKLAGKNKPSSVSRGDSARGDLRQRIVETAKKFIGVPYVWGQSDPSGFDSSGLLYYVFTKNGIKIPRHSMDIYEAGKEISKDELLPGDVVFFQGYQKGPSHGTIYAGNDYFIHSPRTGKTVSLEKLFDGEYWKSRFYGAIRLISDK